jgi:hypothetical protein
MPLMAFMERGINGRGKTAALKLHYDAGANGRRACHLGSVLSVGVGWRRGRAVGARRSGRRGWRGSGRGAARVLVAGPGHCCVAMGSGGALGLGTRQGRRRLRGLGVGCCS